MQKKENDGGRISRRRFFTQADIVLAELPLRDCTMLRVLLKFFK